VLRRIEHFAGQFEYLERAGDQFEYRTKDTARLAGVDPHLIQAQDTGRDTVSDVGTQTTAGLSVRALQSLLLYGKAMAYFRGRSEVGLDDVRAVLPFVLVQKLTADPQASAFDTPGLEQLRTDRVAWLRRLFDTTLRHYDQSGLDALDPVGELLAELSRGLPGVSAAEAAARMRRAEQALDAIAGQGKVYGHLYDDVLALKYVHQRYLNYLAWLKWSR
jgi:hypothetical protein